MNKYTDVRIDKTSIEPSTPLNWLGGRKFVGYLVIMIPWLILLAHGIRTDNWKPFEFLTPYAIATTAAFMGFNVWEKFASVKQLSTDTTNVQKPSTTETEVVVKPFLEQ